MKEIFTSIFTDGGFDWDFTKILGALVLLVFLSLTSYYYVAKDAVFNPVEWATGATIIIGGAAGVAKFRDGTVPKQEQKEG